MLLTKRMTSLRRDLVHVSELMRDSISRLQDITPAAALSPSTRVTMSDSGSVSAPTGTKATGSMAMASPSRYSSLEPTASVASYHTAIGVDDVSGIGAGTPSRAASQEELQLQELTGAAALATLTDGRGASSSPGPVTQQQQQQQQDGPALKLDGIELQGLEAGKKAGGLSAQVADALKQPVPVGAYVVRDIKISRLAGELEPVMM